MLEKIFLAEFGETIPPPTEPIPINPIEEILASFGEAGIWAIIGVGVAQGLMLLKNYVELKNKRKNDQELLYDSLKSYHKVADDILANIEENISGNVSDRKNNILPSFDATPIHHFLNSRKTDKRDKKLIEYLYVFLNTTHKYNRLLDRIDLREGNPNDLSDKTRDAQVKFKNALPDVKSEIDNCVNELKNLGTKTDIVL